MEIKVITQVNESAHKTYKNSYINKKYNKYYKNNIKF